MRAAYMSDEKNYNTPQKLGLSHFRCSSVGFRGKLPTGEGRGSAGVQNPLVHTFDV